MGEFKAGDKVRVLRSEDPYFQIGDFASLTRQSPDGDWLADFNGHGNAEVYGDGCLWIYQNKPDEKPWFELVESKPLEPTSILLKAEALVNGDRAKAYGDPQTNFQRWADILRPLGIILTPYQLALVMVAGKLARQTHAAKEDNLVDAAGYLELAHRLHSETDK